MAASAEADVEIKSYGEEKLMRSHYTRAMSALSSTLRESIAATPSLDPCVPDDEKLEPFTYEGAPTSLQSHSSVASVRDAVQGVRDRLHLLDTCTDLAVARVLLQQVSRKIGLATRKWSDIKDIVHNILLPIVRVGLVLPFVDVLQLCELEKLSTLDGEGGAQASTAQQPLHAKSDLGNENSSKQNGRATPSSEPGVSKGGFVRGANTQAATGAEVADVPYSTSRDGIPWPHVLSSVPFIARAVAKSLARSARAMAAESTGKRGRQMAIAIANKAKQLAGTDLVDAALLDPVMVIQMLPLVPRPQARPDLEPVEATTPATAPATAPAPAPASRGSGSDDTAGETQSSSIMPPSSSVNLEKDISDSESRTRPRQPAAPASGRVPEEAIAAPDIFADPPLETGLDSESDADHAGSPSDAPIVGFGLDADTAAQMPPHAVLTGTQRSLRNSIFGMQRDCLDLLIELLKTTEAPPEDVIPPSVIALLVNLLALP